MQHRAGNGALADRWTRNYNYDEHSNRMTRTYSGTDSADAINYRYDTHGSILNLINTTDSNLMRWNYSDMLHALNCIGGGWAYYQYDSTKERNRKMIERLNGIVEDRQYFGGTEWYRRKNNAGNIVEEIETHHLFAGDQRVLVVEDVINTDNALLTANTLYRYQYSNHLGSVCLELNENAGIISYEEYHPYGTSAYKTINKNYKPNSQTLPLYRHGKG